MPEVITENIDLESSRSSIVSNKKSSQIKQ